MKIETGSFTPNSAKTIVSLTDTTMNVKGVHFLVEGAGATIQSGSGFDDGVTPRGNHLFMDSTGTDNGRSTQFSILLKKRSGGVIQNALRGNITDLSYPGEFEVTWDLWENTNPVYFMAIGD